MTTMDRPVAKMKRSATAIDWARLVLSHGVLPAATVGQVLLARRLLDRSPWRRGWGRS